MKKLKFLPILLTLCIIFSVLAPIGALAADAPENTAKSALVLDRKTGRAIYSKNADTVLAPASTTKIMTALLAVEAIENGDAALSDEVTASAAMTFDLLDDGSSAGIRVGETMTLEDLLYCTMLASANEACNIIAQHLAGDIPSFIQRMNERARELECYTTRFTNTHGLPDVNHYTTAYDLAKIALEASGHPLFMNFCGAAEKTLPATNMSGERKLSNSNALLSSGSIYGSGYVYDGVSGMKTGHTTAAGYCLVSTAEKNGMELLCLVFGEGSSDACFTDSAKLLNWAFENPDGTVVINTDTLLANPVEATPAAVNLAVGENGVPPVASAAAIVLNRENGDVFYSKSPEARVYPADLTKLMTALIAVEAVESGSIDIKADVGVSSNAFSDLTSASTQMLKAGETLSLESLLNLAMLSSADDACNAIAEYICGSISAFIDKMNERAKELGCSATHFSNTHGAQSEDHYTTASDFSQIALEASEHALLMNICNTVTVEIPATNQSAARTLKNTNALICDQSVYGKNYLYERASGMKTGYNSSAGYCLASTAEDHDSGINLLTLVFGGVRQGRDFTCFTDTIALYDWVFDNYSYQEVLKATENIASVDIALGSDADYVNLHPATSIYVLLPNDYDPDDVQIEMVVYSLMEGKKLTAPITNGEVLGEVTVSHDGRNYGTVKLLASASVDLSRMQYIKSQISQTLHSRTFKLVFWICFLVFLAYIVWVIIYRVKHLRHLLAKREAQRVTKGRHLASKQTYEAPVQKRPEIEYFRDGAENEEAERKSAAEITVFPGAQAAQEADPAPLIETSAPKHTDPFPPAPKPLTPSAKDVFSSSQDKAERDYFEEFFKTKD